MKDPHLAIVNLQHPRSSSSEDSYLQPPEHIGCKKILFSCDGKNIKSLSLQMRPNNSSLSNPQCRKHVPGAVRISLKSCRFHTNYQMLLLSFLELSGTLLWDRQFFFFFLPEKTWGMQTWGLDRVNSLNWIKRLNGPKRQAHYRIIRLWKRIDTIPVNFGN